MENALLLGLKDRCRYIERGQFVLVLGLKDRFLIEVFEQYARQNKAAVLLLVGIGPDYDTTKKRVGCGAYKNRIILYGETNTPEKLYSTMDVFVLPSRYEGLPVVLVEAECNGLHCIISDKVTNEMNIGNHISSLSLDDSLQSWCDTIQAIPETDRLNFYYDNQKSINEYDIEECSKRLEQLYVHFVKN